VHASTEDKWCYKEQLSWGTRAYILSVPNIPHENFVRFQCKIGREDIFKPTIRNESLHEISNDNGIRAVNFGASKNLIVKSTVFLHCNIHQYTWTWPDGKVCNQMSHVLIDKGWHSNVVNVWSFRAAACGTDHYLVVVKDWDCQ